jgi:hypothetical protein
MKILLPADSGYRKRVAGMDIKVCNPAGVKI